MKLSEIADVIKNMDYAAFRETHLWKQIAYFVKHEAGNKCSLCSNTEQLEAHHNTYENHGYEWLYWKTDLICLCHECHDRFHKEKGNLYKKQVTPPEIVNQEKAEILKVINEASVSV